jgi:hypothetical protein
VTRCICGCERRGPLRHHCVYEQELDRIWRGAEAAERRGGRAPLAWPTKTALWRDSRNLVPVAHSCHGAHHNRSRPLSAWRLPDGVFEFARELLGAGAAYEYISRRYAGSDARLEALLQDDLHGRGLR